MSQISKRAFRSPLVAIVVALRLYGPLEPWIEKTWRPGEIELVE